MLGRTHIAIGVTAAAAIAPIALSTHWVTLRGLTNGHLALIPHTVVAEATLVVGAVVGSLMPDLEERNSLMSHKVERIGQLVITATLIALVILLHLQTSIGAWAFVTVFSLLSGARSNMSRMVGLAVLGAGLLFASITGYLPLAGGILLAAWIAGAMFTPHRTFTHSLLGIAMLATGTAIALTHFHIGIVAYGIIIGYAFHMIADAVAGGVPLLWPWPQRQGVRLVQTGSAWDHMIGGLAALAFIGFAVL
jgi:membrane-bound metal-dependent hydrolase YbcI (DUF457 family)